MTTLRTRPYVKWERYKYVAKYVAKYVWKNKLLTKVMSFADYFVKFKTTSAKFCRWELHNCRSVLISAEIATAITCRLLKCWITRAMWYPKSLTLFMKKTMLLHLRKKLIVLSNNSRNRNMPICMWDLSIWEAIGFYIGNGGCSGWLRPW